MKNHREKIKFIVSVAAVAIICAAAILLAKSFWRHENQVGVMGSFLLIICSGNYLFSFSLISSIEREGIKQSIPANPGNKTEALYKAAMLAMLGLFLLHIAIGVFLASFQYEFEAISCLVLASIYFSCFLFTKIRIKLMSLK